MQQTHNELAMDFELDALVAYMQDQGIERKRFYVPFDA